jgi:transglutaminase-like putative cysteine protease
MGLVSAWVLLPSTACAAEPEINIDDSASGRGKVVISCKTGNTKALKVLIVKGDKKYSYNLKNDGTAESFPLQMGDGDYKASVLEKLKGDTYRYLESKVIPVALESPDSVYLNSVQNIRWEPGNKAILKDRELIGKEKAYDKKVNIIYQFLVKNFEYDYDKLENLQSTYLPDIDATLKEKKGICYDYSSLFAAMKRSEGVPTKLVKGYSTNVDGYHAWNEIKINGKWVIIDTTYDSCMYNGKSKIKYTMVKDPKDYKKVNEY